jgi:Protein kinase domain
MLPLTADDPRVVGEFRLHARLGSGGMGRVYLGHSPGGRAVAVKVVHPHLARDAAFVDRFRREVAAAQAVNGSYATPVVAAGPDDDPPWLATAYVSGPSLADVVSARSSSGGPLPEDAVVKLAAGLAEALRVIHGCGLVRPGPLTAPGGRRARAAAGARRLAAGGRPGRGACGRARPRPGASRPEADERAAGRGRAPGHRLRRGPGAGRHLADRHRRHVRHPVVHVARAGAEPPGGPAQRRVRARQHAVLRRHRRYAVRRR